MSIVTKARPPVVLFALCLGSAFALPACQTLEQIGTKTADPFSEYRGNAAPVETILCIWQAGEGQGLDHKQTRGFVGQIYFFTQDNEPTLIEDGEIAITLRDQQTGLTMNDKPLHRFVFKGKAWRNHLTMTKAGPAYEVFIPYTRTGSFHARCGLWVEYQPEPTAENPNPRTPFSSRAMVVLSGPKRSTLQTTHRANVTTAGNPASNLRADRESLKRLIDEAMLVKKARHEIASPPRPLESMPAETGDVKRFRLSERQPAESAQPQRPRLPATKPASLAPSLHPVQESTPQTDDQFDPASFQWQAAE